MFLHKTQATSVHFDTKPKHSDKRDIIIEHRKKWVDHDSRIQIHRKERDGVRPILLVRIRYVAAEPVVIQHKFHTRERKGGANDWEGGGTYTTQLRDKGAIEKQAGQRDGSKGAR